MQSYNKGSWGRGSTESCSFRFGNGNGLVRCVSFVKTNYYLAFRRACSRSAMLECDSALLSLNRSLLKQILRSLASRRCVAGDGFEPSTSWLWAARATCCSIPRYVISYYLTVISGAKLRKMRVTCKKLGSYLRQAKKFFKWVIRLSDCSKIIYKLVNAWKSMNYLKNLGLFINFLVIKVFQKWKIVIYTIYITIW